jgi:hypothetical protein
MYKHMYTGVQRINNVYHIVNKVENVCVFQYIFNLIDNVEYVVYALYSSIVYSVRSDPEGVKKNYQRVLNFLPQISGS